MILLAFSVHDSKAESYTQPFFYTTTGQAIRAFQAAASEEGHNFNRFAADYTLFHVGSFNQETGLLEHVIPLNLGNALTFRQTATDQVLLSEAK